MQQACLHSADSKILSPLRNFSASSSLTGGGQVVKVRSGWPFTVPGYRAMGVQTAEVQFAEHSSSSSFVT